MTVQIGTTTALLGCDRNANVLGLFTSGPSRMKSQSRNGSLGRGILMGGGLLLIGLVGGVVGGSFTRNFGSSNYTISYADFVSILLTAVSLLMTILAIFLAVIAFVGWNAITGRVAERTEQFLSEGFKEGNALHTLLRTRATEIMYEGVLTLEPAEDDSGPETND